MESSVARATFTRDSLQSPPARVRSPLSHYRPRVHCARAPRRDDLVARRRRAPAAPALRHRKGHADRPRLGAAAWAFSTHVVSFILTAAGLSIAIAPLVFLGGHLIARTPSIRSAAVLTLALVLLTLAGHPETELHVVAMAAAYTLFESRGKRTLACALAAGLAAPLLCATPPRPPPPP